tara:strand:+ start:631 stop:984 length:354 start_codon:yes stop_codon:yes gene_type:complete
MSTEYQAKAIVGIAISEKDFHQYATSLFGEEFIEKEKKYCAWLLESFTHDLFGDQGESFFVENETNQYKFGITIKNNQDFLYSIKDIENASKIFSEKFNYRFNESKIPKLIFEVFNF